MDETCIYHYTCGLDFCTMECECPYYDDDVQNFKKGDEYLLRIFGRGEEESTLIPARTRLIQIWGDPIDWR